MPTIYVSRNGNSHQLRLRDSLGDDPGNDDLTTNVSAGDTVTWQLDPRAGDPEYPAYKPIDSITAVQKADASLTKYQGSEQLLTATPVCNNSVCTGTVVSPSPGKGKFENYKIGFTVPGDATVYWDDPKLNMN
jgi:hypothetical protein